MNKQDLIKELNRRINLLNPQIKHLKTLKLNTSYIEGKVNAYNNIILFVKNGFKGYP